MLIRPEDFAPRFAEALDRRSASLFVGAGLSIAAGYPDWGSLLVGIAKEIGLDIKRESDFPAVAQFYVNRANANRAEITQHLVNTFKKRPREVPANHRILARLPFGHIWTQNYDETIELAWEQSSKRLDVKSRNNDLTTSYRDADAVLYKMHGTVSQPDDTILTKDDYDMYARSRSGFLRILESQLITHTFLFLGLSFTDPNLNYLMSAIRDAFTTAARTHYTILKRPTGDYERNRFDLFAADLLRYGIRVCPVDTFDEITSVLGMVERTLANKNVFVSGSYPEDGDAGEREFIQSVARGVGHVIAKRGLNLISGFGRTVGAGVLSGLIDELYSGGPGGTSAAALARRMTIRPNRDVAPDGMSVEDFKRRYREDMIAQAGIVLFIGGLRKGEVAPGVLEELRIAVAQKKIILPIAATGYAAKQIHADILERPADYLPPEISVDDIRDLGEETASLEAIMSAVDRCLAKVGRPT
jgi:hypothetical protein